jgi:hypothetical protein
VRGGSCGDVSVDGRLSDTVSADENTRTITRGGSVVAAGYPAWADNVGGTGNVASYPLNASGETAIDETGKAGRFFRLRAVEQ